MTRIKTAEIRQSFLEFFQKHDHTLVESSPVIPFDDPTILFINAGMNQFKDVFTGQRKPDFPRATSSQKCIRAGGKHNDLDNVGFTARHHTFFEMLGSFSFGDYFKEEAIKFHWDWITKELKMPVDKLWASVYDDDDEAFALWEKIAPELKNGRILRFGKKDNYWTMGDIGPCGPCSEIHYDRGEQFGTGPDDVVNGDGERFVEIANLVFMQYEQTAGGKLIDLPKPSVDTGSGLERIAAIMQGVDSNYGIDLFKNIIAAISDITGAKYADHVSSHHVIADHIRALTFAIADGAGVSNEGRGYVLRRILRRAARHGRELGAREPFLHRLVSTLVAEMGETYPAIAEKQDHVVAVIKSEEESFARTLDTGLELFSSVAKKIKASGSKVVPGDEVFKLYDTYGFPYDLTETIAAEQGLTLDKASYDEWMHQQKVLSREAANFAPHEAITDAVLRDNPPTCPATKFLRDDVTSRGIVKRMVDATIVTEGVPITHFAIVLDRTPFYAKAGGQVGDRGKLFTDKFELQVEKTRSFGPYTVHLGDVVRGTWGDLSEDETVTAAVDTQRRWDIMRNHTATHLAHAALHQVLGDHAKQSGSYVGPDRLRFDFSHHQPMTPDEIAEVERMVNEQILNASEVTTDEMSPDDAKAKGAMALFGEKYGDTVRVVSVADFSMELCGGTHVTNTSQIGPFFITVETGIASGVRRLEAVTGTEAQRRMLKRNKIVNQVSKFVNRPEDEILSGVEQLKSDYTTLQKEIKKLKTELVSGAGQSIGTESKVGELTLWTHDFGETDRETLSAWIDSRKEMNEPLVALAIGISNGKPTVMLAVSSAASNTNAGNLLKELLAAFGGRGGGKPNFAQGGMPAGVTADDLIAKLSEILK